MNKFQKRLEGILDKYKKRGLADTDFQKLEINKTLFKNNRLSSIGKIAFILLIISVIGVVFCFYQKYEFECFIEMPDDASKLFREPEMCDICINLTSVDKVENIPPELFDEYYVKTGRPVVVADGALNWPALDKFTFEFFKRLYLQNEDVDDDNVSPKTCQFFPYKTEFRTLKEALNVNPKQLSTWYIGWSNCNNRAGQIIKSYYKTPYFLPNISESIALNWIFMGGPGNGAHMHVDNVQYPSWQAQLSGRKLWRLAPPPECYYQCKEMQVVVEKGEIIVVDTNRWYHQTLILPGEISITIGAEFD